MCGIVGKYNLNEEPVSPELINRMCDKLIHRGPDDSDIFVDSNIGLGHRRLSIIDLSELGRQPMSSQDQSIWITFNGEIYNFQELKTDLISKGYSFKSNSDTEVIIYLYQEYQEKCLDLLRGMFAFAIWDKSNQILFLARDRIGKKPLYYYFNGKTLLFASEIKSILVDAVVEREINYEAFYDYFKYQYVPDPKTIFKNIYKLNPGNYLVCNKQGVQKKEYWDISFANQNNKNETAIADELLAILTTSVNLRMISDVPLGAFLSGGIDSSCVVALMANQNTKPVTTCSIGFDSSKYDEIKYARTIAQKFNTDHYEFTVKQSVSEILNQLVYQFDEPFADSSAVPTYYVSKLARQKVTVALTGDGGDENFAGYKKYSFDDIENKMRRRIPRAIRQSILPPLSEVLSKSTLSVLQRGATLFNTLGVDPAYGFYLTNTEFNNGLWEKLINEETKRKIGGYDPFSVSEYYYNKADADDHFQKILYVDLKTYLPGDILVKVDRMSMAHSLEVRAPILDHKVIEFSASLPLHLKYNKGKKKYILKKTFETILPDEILYRKKMGFSVPLADWLRGEIKDITYQSLFSPNSACNLFFSINVLKEIWEKHQSKERNYAPILWSILMFELWFNKYIN